MPERERLPASEELEKRKRADLEGTKQASHLNAPSAEHEKLGRGMMGGSAASRTPRGGYWCRVSRQFARDRMAVMGLVLISFLTAVALIADVLANSKPLALSYRGELSFPAFDKLPAELADLPPLEIPAALGAEDWALWAPIPYGPTQQNLERRLLPPSTEHWLGTDDRGRDVLSRMIHGARISLSVGLVAVGIAMIIGILVGALAGYYAGGVDVAFSRLIEVVICFPTFFLILAVLALLPPNIFLIMIVIGLTGWTGIARLIRAEFLKVRTMEYVHAARSVGVPSWKIIFRHILPNAIAPALVSATFGIAAAILVESSLAFLGFGVPPPTPSWGEALSQSRAYIDFAWWLTLFPGLAIFVTITAFNLVGEGLRDAIDPRLAGNRALD